MKPTLPILNITELNLHTREYYHNLRNKYSPSDLKTVFVLESPPVSGKYFYDLEGEVGEPLFRAMMQLLKVEPQTKAEGLDIFQNAGCIIVDATYTPVNDLKDSIRSQTILNSYQALVEDLRKVCGNSKPDIILVKANICRLLEPKLASDGFKIKNQGAVVPFPSTGQQGNFASLMKKLY
ncbi:MAG: hypothetical protein JKX85_11120 [Phycisphaeraceae bacterium]|nr:hypothetical protein [Phycisphaeraceae bacterium]